MLANFQPIILGAAKRYTCRFDPDSGNWIIYENGSPILYGPLESAAKSATKLFNDNYYKAARKRVARCVFVIGSAALN